MLFSYYAFSSSWRRKSDIAATLSVLKNSDFFEKNISGHTLQRWLATLPKTTANLEATNHNLISSDTKCCQRMIFSYSGTFPYDCFYFKKRFNLFTSIISASIRCKISPKFYCVQQMVRYFWQMSYWSMHNVICSTLTFLRFSLWSVCLPEKFNFLFFVDLLCSCVSKGRLQNCFQLILFFLPDSLRRRDFFANPPLSTKKRTIYVASIKMVDVQTSFQTA